VPLLEEASTDRKPTTTRRATILKILPDFIVFSSTRYKLNYTC